MSVPTAVYLRANFCCEYCGVSETDVGGELTLDHIQPKGSGGSDELTNLLYCCYRCNLNKGDYWPTEAAEPMLWNPREEPASRHFLLLADGVMHPISAQGKATIDRLRLNRPSLVSNRLRRLNRIDELRLLAEFRYICGSLNNLQTHLDVIVAQQDKLLELHRVLLQRILDERI